MGIETWFAHARRSRSWPSTADLLTLHNVDYRRLNKREIPRLVVLIQASKTILPVILDFPRDLSMNVIGT